jgi:hypothetical protein
MFEVLSLLGIIFLTLFVMLLTLLFILTSKTISDKLDPHLHDLFDDGEPNNVPNQEDTTKKTL